MTARTAFSTAAFYGWWLLINGAVFYAEYAFLLRLAGGQERSWRRLLPYLCVNCALTLLSLSLALPVPLRELLHAAALCAFARLLLRQPWRRVMVPAAVIVTLGTLTDGMSAMAMGLMAAHLSGPKTGVFLQLVLSVLTTGFLFAAYRFISDRYGAIAEEERLSCLSLLLLPCAFVILTVRYGVGLDRPVLFPSGAPLMAGPPLWAFACAAGAFMTFFAALEIHAKAVLLANQRTEQALLAAQLQRQRVYLSEAASRAAQYRAFQHDIKNHLLILSGLSQEGRYEELRNYLGKLNLISHALTSYVSTGNAVLDVLLNEKIRYAEQSGVPVTCSVQVPQDLSVDEMDLCAVFSNALDNAIEACLQEQEARRGISLTAQPKHRFLLIEVTNPCHSSAPVQPGTGLKNIAYIAKKYNGAMDIQKSGSTFRLHVLLCESAEAGPPFGKQE